MVLLRELAGEQIRRVSNPVIQRLITTWIDAKPRNGLPPSPTILSALRAGCSDTLMELVPNSNGAYRYVHYGQSVARYAGFDMTGKTTADFSSEIGRFFKDKYDEAIASQQALYTVHRAEHAADVFSWERLILPLADPDQEHYLLVYNQPLQHRHELLDAILQATADGVLALEIDDASEDGTSRLVVVLANQAMCGIAGVSEPAMLFGRTLEACMLPEAEPEIARHCLEAISTGEAKSLERANPFSNDGRSVAISITPMTGGVSLTIQDITARKAQEKADERARLAAEEANRSKSDFLARMSHELRTPLNAIIGFSAILEMHGTKPPEKSIAREVGYIKTAAEHLLGLIEDVVEISKLEVGRERLRIERVDLGELLPEVLAYSRSIVGAERLTVQGPEPGTALGFVQADGLRLRQVLINLLSNAIKYNFPGGTVTMTVEPLEERRVRIAVADTGMGIPPDATANVFEPFDRLGQEHGRIEGTGLGLALSKRLIDGMGGAIDFTSTIGQGSRFWIDIPVAADVGAEPESKDGTGPCAATSGRDQPVIPQQPKVVLYIEDNPANMMLMREVTQMASGVRLLEAKTAETGLAILEMQQPDIIFVDINLPGMDGYDVLERVRGNPELESIETIAISASALPADVQKGLDAGFDRYITKPVDVQELLRILGS